LCATLQVKAILQIQIFWWSHVLVGRMLASLRPLLVLAILLARTISLVDLGGHLVLLLFSCTLCRPPPNRHAS
jgi:hypothetical protein